MLSSLIHPERDVCCMTHKRNSMHICYMNDFKEASYSLQISVFFSPSDWRLLGVVVKTLRFSKPKGKIDFSHSYRCFTLADVLGSLIIWSMISQLALSAR